MTQSQQQGVRHGIFAVPAVPETEYPITMSLMQSPYPWGQLHVSVCAFVPQLRQETATLLRSMVQAAPQLTLEPVSIETKESWRTNIVLRLQECTEKTLEPFRASVKEHFPRDNEKAIDMKATLWYGKDALPSKSDIDAVMREMRSVPWELALVTRQDLGSTKTEGLPRQLSFYSASRGEWSCATGSPKDSALLAIPDNLLTLIVRHVAACDGQKAIDFLSASKSLTWQFGEALSQLWQRKGLYHIHIERDRRDAADPFIHCPSDYEYEYDSDGQMEMVLPSWNPIIYEAPLWRLDGIEWWHSDIDREDPATYLGLAAARETYRLAKNEWEEAQVEEMSPGLQGHHGGGIP